jgi:non-specific serine/threonine protein kinase
MMLVLATALLAYEDERIAEAHALADAALVFFRANDDKRRSIDALEILAEIDRFNGERPRAADRYAQAVDLAREVGDDWLIAHLMERGGLVAWAAGEYGRAGRDLSASLDSFRQLGDTQGAAFALWELGSVDVQVGRLDAGIERMEQAVPILRRGRHRRQLARALFNLGVAYLGRGDVARAEAALQEGILAFRDVKMGRHMSVMFTGFAASAEARGNHERAARLLGAAARVWENANWNPPSSTLELWNRCDHSCRERLGSMLFDAAVAEGRAWTPDAALAEAMRPASDYGAGMTAREFEILQLVAQGLSNADISSRLLVDVRTVHAHLRSLYVKLDVGSRSAAVRSARELGLV